MITEKEISLLWESWLGQRAYGQPRTFSAVSLPVATRMVHRRASDLRGAGYIEPSRQTHGVGYFAATDKVLEHVPVEPVDLAAVWQASRDSYNKLALPFVWLERLTKGQQRGLVEQENKYGWFLLHEDLTRSHPMSIQVGDKLGPVVGTLQRGVPALLESGLATLAAQKRSTTCRFLLAVQTPELVEHARRKCRDEEIARTVAANLAWGLASYGVLPEKRAEAISSSNSPSWIMGSGCWGNLGDDPAKWGDYLADKLSSLEEHIRRETELLQTLREVDQGIAQLGGWAVFRERLTASAAEAVDERERRKEDDSATTQA